MPARSRKSPSRGPAPATPAAPTRSAAPVSNQAQQARITQPGGPVSAGPTAAGPTTAGPTTAGPTTAGPTAAGPAGPAAANDTPAWAQRGHVGGTLKEGATGPEVESLQKALGIPVTGTFDAATKTAVVAFQKQNKLGDDGIAGKKTLKKLGLRDEMRSSSHSDTAFIPKYRATAYSESDMYRKKDDPYAVGAITNPEQKDDDGGKTYGTYQFESYIYRDGSKKSDGDVTSSTLMRFVNDKNNPYADKLQAVVKKNGVASKEFDALWKELTSKENKAFGQAQEKFLEKDVGDKVKNFYETAKVPEALRNDEDLYDVVIGTVNQYGGIAARMSATLAEKIKEMKSPTADSIGKALQDIKAAGVESHFKRSPKAWDGIRERITREKGMFES